MNLKLLQQHGMIVKENGVYALSKDGQNFAVFCLLSKTYAEEFPECAHQQPDETHTQHVFNVLVRKGILFEDKVNFTDYGGKVLWGILESLTEDEFDDLVTCL